VAARVRRAKAQYRTYGPCGAALTMAFVTGADTMAQTRFVVEVVEPVPGERVADVAARIAARFDMDVRRVRKLLEGRTGPVTRPLSREKADRIARAFSDVGVAVDVEPEASRPAAPEAATPLAERRHGTPPPGRGDEEPPANVFLSSTRWVPSPHEEGTDEGADAGEDAGEDAAGAGTLVEGQAAAVLSEPAAGGGPPAAGAEPRPVATAEPRRERARAARRPGARSYLLAAFGAALVILLALQALYRADRGNAPASAESAMEAGLAAYAGGDFAQAKRVWMPLAESGNARAQYMLGYMAENGQGRAWSNHDAADWYGRAAAQRYPEAQVALGQLYRRGMGVDRHPQRAVALFRAAAQEGYGPGQFQYALALFHGTGVPQDFREALKWFRAAAANGVAEARPYVAFAGTASGDGGATAVPQPDAGQTGAPR